VLGRCGDPEAWGGGCWGSRCGGEPGVRMGLGELQERAWARGELGERWVRRGVCCG